MDRRLPEAFFEASLETMLDPFVILGAVRDVRGAITDFEYLYANAAACAHNQMLREELLGRRLLEVMPEHAAAGLLARYAQVVDTGEPLVLSRLHYEGYLAGRPMAATFDVRAHKIGDALIYTWRDVTDIERQEIKDRFQAHLLDEIDAAVIATDPGLRIVYWNKGAERLLGWSKDAVLGRSATEVIIASTPPDSPQVAALRDAVTQNNAGGAELDLLRENGSTVTVMARSVPLEQGGRSEGGVGIMVDIGKLKAAEREVEESSAFLTAITDNMAEGMLSVDRSGRLTFLNAGGAQLLGWSKTDLLGREMHEAIHFERLDGTPYPADECPLTKARTAGEPARVSYEVFIRRDGTRLPVSCSTSPLWSGSNHSEDALRGTVVVFQDISDRLSEEVRVQQELGKLAWVGRIKDALDRDRFVLYAQPITSLLTGEVTRHELLIRMVADGGEIVPASKFLQIAEEFGIIGRIDEWVVAQSALLAGSGHHVEFSLSGESVTTPGMADRIIDTLTAAGAPADNLVCEITETALMRDVAAAGAFVRALTDSGCRVALDDFGASYGGLAYLKRLPVSYLKIDKQFVQDIVENVSSRHVVKAVVSLARGFGLETVAKGAGNDEMVQVLRDLGVDFVQSDVSGPAAPLDTYLQDR